MTAPDAGAEVAAAAAAEEAKPAAEMDVSAVFAKLKQLGTKNEDSEDK